MPAKGRGIVTSGITHPPGDTHRAGYELITTAPRPRTAVFRSRRDSPGEPNHDGQPPRPAPITQAAKPVARSPTDLPSDLSYSKSAELVHVPTAVRVVRIALPAQAGIRPGSIDHATARCIRCRLRRHVQKTGIRTRWHHQHHDPGAPDQPERHETPDPLRSNALDSRFHRVRLRHPTPPDATRRQTGTGHQARECTAGRQRQVFLATVAEAAPALERAPTAEIACPLALRDDETPSIPAGRAARSAGRQAGRRRVMSRAPGTNRAASRRLGARRTKERTVP